MRYAICNETFEGWDHGRICQFVAEAGYTGLELAPFTLAPLITDLSMERRVLMRRQAEDSGVKLIGLHWLLAHTQGFHITSPEEQVRRATSDYLVELARCCRDLGGDILVFGSPAQRYIPPGFSREHALFHAVDTFRRAMPGVADAGVRICFEPLTPHETDFINTCAEAVELVEAVDHRNFVLHLDVKAMANESIPTPLLIRRHASRTGHFHANDPNKRGPGFGSTDFVPIFRALQEAGYQGWISVEVFDYSPDPETIARESFEYMSECARRAGQPVA